MNLQTLFQDFNPSKFVVHTCLLIFTALFALRLDNTITWTYWSVFAPIWAWKLLVISGAMVGTYVWWRYPHLRLEGEAYVHYNAMLMSLALHLILLMFELLVCDKLDSGRHLWILVFIPGIFVSVVSIAVCVWSVAHDRSYELELFCAVNILQLIFVALKLDGFIAWSWEVVFVPLWIIMCLSLVGVLYSIIFAGILLRTPEVNAQQRRSSVNSALAYTFTVLPILVFQDVWLTAQYCVVGHKNRSPRLIHFLTNRQAFEVLLANKLDSGLELPYIIVVSPLFFTFTALIIMSFNSKGGNRWWFGIRKDFCHFLLSVFPCLQEYANIAYNNDGTLPANVTVAETAPREREQLTSKANKGSKIKADLLKPVVPIVSIELPD